jgi:hypothetical protein
MSTYPTPLTPVAMQNTMQQLTILWLGISPTDPTANYQVRIGWQTQGQPTADKTKDVCYLEALEVDDDYNRQRDLETVQQEDGDFYLLMSYTRVWSIRWTFYGPNSFDRCRTLKSALFTQIGHDILVAANLYCVPDIAAPRRVPEIYGSEWWERVDFDVRFNEGVYEVTEANPVTSVEISVNDAAGQLAEFTVSE